VATVLAVGTECDIACLTVKDDDFWDGTEAVSFGELPHLQDSILVIGCAARAQPVVSRCKHFSAFCTHTHHQLRSHSAWCAHRLRRLAATLCMPHEGLLLHSTDVAHVIPHRLTVLRDACAATPSEGTASRSPPVWSAASR